MAGQEGLEPPTIGFGDRRSTIGATDLTSLPLNCNAKERANSSI